MVQFMECILPLDAYFAAIHGEDTGMTLCHKQESKKV